MLHYSKESTVQFINVSYGCTKVRIILKEYDSYSMDSYSMVMIYFFYFFKMGHFDVFTITWSQIAIVNPKSIFLELGKNGPVLGSFNNLSYKPKIWPISKRLNKWAVGCTLYMHHMMYGLLFMSHK